MTETGSTSTTTAPDAKVKATNGKWKKDTERMVREKEGGGEGPIKRQRKLHEEEGGVMSSKGPKSKKRTEVDTMDSNSTHAGQ